MPRGTLEVLLVNAKGLENTDFLCKMDPYVILTFRSQEHKSTVASGFLTNVFDEAGKGSEPEWNETFLFTISDTCPELTLKIMDSDTGSQDDFVGEAIVPLEPLFLEGAIPPTTYNVVKDKKYCGEIKLGFKFFPEEHRERGFSGKEETYGGWKQSY